MNVVSKVDRTSRRSSRPTDRVPADGEGGWSDFFVCISGFSFAVLEVRV